MRWTSGAGATAALVVLGWAMAGEPVQEPIDWARVRQIRQKVDSGQPLTDEERAFVRRTIEARNRGALSRPATRPRPVTPAASLPAVSSRPTTSATGFVPLNEMAAADRYKGEDGGLYGAGRDEPPAEHQKAARSELARIVPLDAQGRPAADGRIVFISIGMSNTTMEFSKFKELADRDAAKSPAVVIVDGAQGGRDAPRWAQTGDGSPWGVLDLRLAGAGVTARQVQVAWVKQVIARPEAIGEFPRYPQALKDGLIATLTIARERFPNLRVAYLSSRIYAGYATVSGNPEPYAYESAFAVRWLIQDQIKGLAALNYDPAKGAVKAPLVLWGPYLWADGLTPRKTGGLVWKREDLAPDGMHPSQTVGREKVARILLDFLKTNPYAIPWFQAQRPDAKSPGRDRPR